MPQVMIIGGWAHRLYRLHPSAQRIEYVPLTTLDTDIAVPARLKVIDTDMRERLIAHGFEEERLGSDQPPATYYRLGDANTGFYAEFLTPLYGPEHGRDGKAKATRRVAGVVSQQLRHLEILLLNPWTVSLSGSNGFPFEDPKELRIPNPVSFLAHKVLIHKKRMRAKFAKDVLYIHDTLEIFGARLDNLNLEWRSEVKPKIHLNAVRKVQRAATDLFGQLNDPIRDAARMTGARKLSAEAVRERCNFGLAQIFNRS
ncbi:MAG: hypothetical protein HYR76_00030 [Ignavibacteria bacterium]|nr:hypothetical protein [Ignavibacteria bacterium]